MATATFFRILGNLAFQKCNYVLAQKYPRFTNACSRYRPFSSELHDRFRFCSKQGSSFGNIQGFGSKHCGSSSVAVAEWSVNRLVLGGVLDFWESTWITGDGDAGPRVAMEIAFCARMSNDVENWKTAGRTSERLSAW